MLLDIKFYKSFLPIKIWIVFFLLINISFNLLGQDTIEPYIKKIRNEFELINKNLNKDYHKNYLFKDEIDTINFDGYFNYSQLVLLISEENKNGIYEKNHLYYKNGYLIFIFRETMEQNGNQKQERFYYFNNNLIRGLIKLKESTDNLSFSEINNIQHPDLKIYYETICINNETYNRPYSDAYKEKEKSLYKKFNTYKVFPEALDENQKIALIKKEYQKINSEKVSYNSNKVTYTYEYDPDRGQMEGWSVTYWGYFSSNNQLVLLSFTLYDGGYNSDYDYYFKDEKIFFLSKTNDYEPENKKSIEQYYIYNDKPILRLEKMKKYDDETPFSKINFIKKDLENLPYYVLNSEYIWYFFKELFKIED